MNPPSLSSAKLGTLPRSPLDEGDPVFAEPWQAKAFALAVKLSELGHFTWHEWATALADELKADAARGEPRALGEPHARGEPHDVSRYYDCWLAALERLVVAKGLTDTAALIARNEAWADAFRQTPHGMPVELKRDSGASA